MTCKNRLLVGSALAGAVLVACYLGLAFRGIPFVMPLLQLAFSLTIIVWLAHFRRRQVKVTEELQKISRLVEEIKRERETIQSRSTRRSRRGTRPQRRIDRRW